MIERVEVDQFSDNGDGFDLIVYERVTRTETITAEIGLFGLSKGYDQKYPGRNYSSLETRIVKPYDPEYETLMRLYGPGAKT